MGDETVPRPGYRISLRRLSFWLALGCVLALLLGVAVVATVTHSALRLAERGGADTSAQRMEGLRAVGNLERMIALGDQFQAEAVSGRWRDIGLTMQALALHPSVGALGAGNGDGVDGFEVASHLLRLREQEGSGPPEARAALAARREAYWLQSRVVMQAVADDVAAGMVREVATAAEEISRGARMVLAATLAGALAAAALGAILLVAMRCHLFTPLLRIADALAGWRRGEDLAGRLPEVHSEEMGEMVEAVSRLAKAQHALERATLYDPLTGLSNRYGLEARLAQAIGHARRQGGRMALMFIDLDRFKTVNDSFGHASGDELLRIVADRFSGCLSEGDLVARLGGDEFVVVLGELAHVQDAAQVAQKLLDCACRPARVQGFELRLSASIGICLFPDDGQDAGALMRHADIAMYQAKAQGRAGFRFFEAVMNEAVARRLQIETELRQALDRHEFRLHFQPQMDPAGQRIVAAEALIRWQRESGELVSPAAFIPVAEESGLVADIGLWVLQSACEQLAEWRSAGLEPVRLAINLSARQLRDPELPVLVERVLSRQRIDPALLELEVTESVAMQRPETTIANLRALKALGVSLAIDDFGTGYSSLAYLKLFPLDRLKLDQTFVRDIEHDPNDASICAATVGLAHSLRLELVAEGVETRAQHAFLRDLGCDLLQGYLFHRPMPAGAFAVLLEHQQAGGPPARGV
ncbi:EAL domain-containing protein [Pseudothauera nasutitermitis]|uniref:EAL domain-containing protein n=1 Tax=Pseudothauera nasutitermitis TaxID=2565930 RepID=A0A4S4B180_9RHOO|nr:EAL domain-containing protein [Pseudothauera nasutitermitis]THF66301.1 EAL domain-containing protein [Pseudothauera nasutitermitis]